MKKSIFAVASLAAFAALRAGAEYQPSYIEQQLMLSDGQSAAPYVAPRQLKQETPKQAAENAWLEAERIADSRSSKPVPYVAPTPGETGKQARDAQAAAAAVVVPAYEIAPESSGE